MAYSVKLTCSVGPEVANEIDQLVERHIWPNRSAFLRDAVQHSLQRQAVLDQLRESTRLSSDGRPLPSCKDDLVIALRRLQNDVKELRGRTLSDPRVSVLLDQLTTLRERTEECLRVSVSLGVSENVIQALRDLFVEGPPGQVSLFHAALALNMLLEYRETPLSNLPKTDVETWREVSQTAVWRHRTHVALSAAVGALDRIVEKLGSEM
jgi:Arc/MetJ-type ribon-helix-helix transcriptional regulator